MKKKQMWCGLTFAAFGLLTSCSSEETLDVPVGNPIQFAYANVDASTRGADGEVSDDSQGGTSEGGDASDGVASTGATDPSFTTESLQDAGFNVYGWVSNGKESSVLFDGTEVTYDTDDGWTYENTQYWVGGGSYTFSAIAGMNGTLTISEDGKRVTSPKIVGFTTDGETDLIYDEKSETYTSGSGAKTVKFAFQHQLAKVKFTFIDGMPANSQIGIVVKEIKITDAPASGDVVLSATQYGASWSNLSSTTTSLDFGSTGDDFIATSTGTECADERLLIPAASTQEYTVTFKTEIYQGASGTEVLIKTAEHSTTIKDVELKAGYAYNFTATLNEDNLDGGNALYPIVFDEQVTSWTDNTSSAITNYPKSTEDENAEDDTANNTL
jgi:hypothetical protein